MAYVAPTPADLRARYPAFANVLDVTVQVWLDEAATEAAKFPDDVRARAMMAYAAHKLVEAGATGGSLAGVQRFKSADFEIFMGQATSDRTGFATTTYGSEWLMLLQRYFSGPIMAWNQPACGPGMIPGDYDAC